jgi:osomolarity two-component system, sensor histidine kinase SLN1
LQGNNLVTIAVLKSVQINQTLNFLYNQAFAVTTRAMIQRSLVRYYASHEKPDSIFEGAFNDLQTAIGTQPQILAGQIYTNDFTLLPNLSASDVPYTFPASLYPTAIPPIHRGFNSTTTGEILGPVAVPATPGSYALSMTIPILNTNASTSPHILGYMSLIFTAAGLQRAVNDTTGIGQTGQLLVVAKNGSNYDFILPPARTPQVYGQSFMPGQYLAVDMAFQNGTGYYISTRNSVNALVSVGYNV